MLIKLLTKIFYCHNVRAAAIAPNYRRGHPIFRRLKNLVQAVLLNRNPPVLNHLFFHKDEEHPLWMQRLTVVSSGVLLHESINGADCFCAGVDEVSSARTWEEISFRII